MINPSTAITFFFPSQVRLSYIPNDRRASHAAAAETASVASASSDRHRKNASARKKRRRHTMDNFPSMEKGNFGAEDSVQQGSRRRGSQMLPPLESRHPEFRRTTSTTREEVDQAEAGNKNCVVS